MTMKVKYKKRKFFFTKILLLDFTRVHLQRLKPVIGCFNMIRRDEPVVTRLIGAIQHAARRPDPTSA